jgi:hypothetical protein
MVKVMTREDTVRYQPGLSGFNYDREIALFTSGDVFCSMTPEELEIERKAAEEDDERFRILMLQEQASKMTKDDFVDVWKKWSIEEEDWEDYRSRIRKHYQFDHDEYVYARNTYDNNKATDLKLKRWKNLQIVGEHISCIIFIALTFIYLKTDLMWGLVIGGISLINISNVAIKWYHWYTERDTINTVNG